MHVVVLGAGYAGVTVARRLERILPAAVHVTVVNDTAYHLVKHEIHRLIRAPDAESYVRVPIDELFDRASVVVGRVDAVDPTAREVSLADGSTLEYDYAAVCLGARPAFYDLPGVETHGQPLNSITDAYAIRDDFLDVPRDGQVVVVGAGLTGIQVAGELAALADELDRTTEITLVEQESTVAPLFERPFQRAVHDALLQHGIRIETDVTVVGASDDHVETNAGDGFPFDQFVWAGGIKGSGALDGERPRVRSDLALDAHTFVVGDAADVVDADGERVPPTAQAAMREAETVAETIARRVDRGEDVFVPRAEPFRFDPAGWVVSIGDDAVAQVGPTVLRGMSARTVKAVIGARHLSAVGAVERSISLLYDELGLSG